MNGREGLAVDGVDAQAGVILAVTRAPTVVGALAIAEDDDLVTAELLGHSNGDGSAIDGGGADDGVITIADEQDIVDYESIVFGIGQTFDIEFLPDFGAVLTPARTDDCVHGVLLQSSLVSTAAL